MYIVNLRVYVTSDLEKHCFLYLSKPTVHFNYACYLLYSLMNHESHSKILITIALFQREEFTIQSAINIQLYSTYCIWLD